MVEPEPRAEEPDRQGRDQWLEEEAPEDRRRPAREDPAEEGNRQEPGRPGDEERVQATAHPTARSRRTRRRNPAKLIIPRATVPRIATEAKFTMLR